ncbi:ribosome recycling factor [Candidatus Uhrbacteria bacterium RIFCSPLOWO2_12_FULL_46_10]|uniref:Ribosome-recycling factor n=1 Tax=Candidatus Uhrbacteria bacterium RIFCSPLOWO2_01_FULL_47_25 TaxID=1802402 RepID=A0A1F7UV56_9BACT|nr:MAG: Ribosome-recycling factor [Parcubacteria group bacterium GW2011_GWA2_46_9]OGL59045.1 MAG: ribosome recycling factor [Candidatus Uhrbacteria bacterium RIFCSPHIGHO2_01_FULL_46_23]OGL68712.1 MAG: ribosome recycling factor [Candidatus Uhrbacteria bacterium RIFCSPHIGHO2_02_FULL_47_29]OGL74738.1 MAG: ribosome recycling factor [Candidatus Uhrbacteria bacterium RIFCSPHIGHO2_12_FULL_46_13]OGL82149.1 MAG: ribosome recycling factor [Candidatus Uhrbacteria bacterium RIFCSPLOWO2_01_FULL_47_25]OGL85
MMQIIIEHKSEFDRAIEHLKTEFASVRSNRATPSLVEDIKIEAYGSEMRLKELASMTVPEARTIIVQPWDKTIIKDIERSLVKADLSVGIANDGTVIRLTFPPLTAETRQALLKVMNQKLEAARIQVRQIREKAREQIIKAEKEKTITEDDRFRAQKDLDELVKDYIDQIGVLGERKEEEILTV